MKENIDLPRTLELNMAKIIEQQWDIPSSTSNKDYKVTLYDDGSWACSCPHWIYRRAECKHIREAMSLLTEEEEEEEEEVEEETLTLEAHIEALHKQFDGMTSIELYKWYKESPYFNPIGYTYKGKAASKMKKAERLEFVKYLTTDNEVNEYMAERKYYVERINEISFKSEAELKNYGDKLVSKGILRAYKPYYDKDESSYKLDLTETNKDWWSIASKDVLKEFGSYYAFVNNLSLVFEKEVEEEEKEEKDIGERTLEWSLRKIKDSTKKGLIRTDSMILFNQIKDQFENGEEVEFLFDSNEDKMVLKYLPDDPGKNDFVAAKFKTIIDGIIDRNISIENISSATEDLERDIKTYIESVKIGNLNFMDDIVINNIGRIWNSLTEDEREKTFFPVDDGDIDFSKEWDLEILFHFKNELKTQRERELWQQQEGISKKFETLKRIFNDMEYPLICFLKDKKINFELEKIARWWDYLPEEDLDLVLRKFLKREYTDTTILEKDWEELDSKIQIKIKERLGQFKYGLNKGLGKKEQDIEPKISQFEILKNNILEIVCIEQANPDNDGKVSGSIIWGALFSNSFHPEVQYTGADSRYIGEAIDSLLNEGRLEEIKVGWEEYKYYSVPDALINCKEGGIISVKPDFPILEVFPLINNDDITKRVLLQAICRRLISAGKFKRLSKASILKDWLNFFKYDTLIKNDPNYKYLDDALGLKDDIDKKQRFYEDLDYLINNRIVVSYPESYHSPVEMITFQARYKFVFKTYKMGILTDHLGITDCSIFVNEERLQKNEILKTFKERQLLKLLLKEYERFHIITKNNKANIFLIYTFNSFELIVFDDSNSKYEKYDLGFDRKTFRNKIIKEILPKLSQFDLTAKERNHWNCIKKNELLTLAPTIKF